MKLSNERILNDVQGLSKLIQKNLPIKASYAIAKNISKIELELKIYNEENKKLIEKYSVKDRDGKTLVDENNQIRIQEEFLVDWNNDIKKLQEIENEIDIHKFSINELLNGNYDMTPAEVLLIDYMIEE